MGIIVSSLENRHGSALKSAASEKRALPPEIEGPREVEDRCGALALWTYIDYLDGIGQLTRIRLPSKAVVVDMANWQGLWMRPEPGIFHQRQSGPPLRQ